MILSFFVCFCLTICYSQFCLILHLLFDHSFVYVEEGDIKSLIYISGLGMDIGSINSSNLSIAASTLFISRLNRSPKNHIVCGIVTGCPHLN